MLTLGVALVSAGLALGIGALIALHLLPTGLSPLRNPVSQYGITSYWLGYRLQTLGYTLAGTGAAIGVSALPGPTNFVVVLCVAFAAARGAISWFPMDAPGTPRTTTGSWHFVLAIIAFGSAALGAQRFADLLHRDGLYTGVQTWCDVLAVLALVAFLGMSANRQARGNYYGLMERLFYLCMTVWLVLVAVVLALR